MCSLFSCPVCCYPLLSLNLHFSPLFSAPCLLPPSFFHTPIPLPLPLSTSTSQSHTCTNSLELPNYLESVMHLHKNEPSMTPAMINAKVHAILLEKLVIAIANGGEYGLDEPVVQVADNRDSSSARSDTLSSATSDSDSDSDRRPRPTNAANNNNNNNNNSGDGVMAFDDESSGDSLDIPMLGGGGDEGGAKSAAVVPKQTPSAPPPTQAASPNEDSYGDDFESDFETDEDA